MRPRFSHRTVLELMHRPPTRSLHPMHEYHERIEAYHTAVARLAHEAVTAPRVSTAIEQVGGPLPELQAVLERIAEQLTSATREFELLLEMLTAEVRRENVHAIAMLSRAHDDCCGELAHAGDALRTGTSVHVRVRLARLFAALGRAEQAHYYLRTARDPAVQASGRERLPGDEINELGR